MPKGLRPLGGVPLFVHALRAFDACPDVDSHVLVVPAGHGAAVASEQLGLRARAFVVEGGERRQDSVLAGLQAAVGALGTGEPEPRLVAVHDAARPFPDAGLIARTIEGAREAGAAVPVVPASDTVREVAADGTTLRLLDRSVLRLAQTPQTARLDWLLEAYLDAHARGSTVTDEGSALEAAGRKVVLVEGSASNFKITTPGDLAIAEVLATGGGPTAPALRVGYGEDRHPRAHDRPFVLAGVRLSDHDGPAGHSDGDPLCHAVVDAILGAVGAGTIGEMFPDTDPRWAGAQGPELLAGAARRVRERGWRVVNIDAVVVADSPRLAPHASGVRAALAAALDVAEDCVSVKGKRAEGLGFEGSGAGVSCRAIALLAPVRAS